MESKDLINHISLLIQTVDIHLILNLLLCEQTKIWYTLVYCGNTLVLTSRFVVRYINLQVIF